MRLLRFGLLSVTAILFLPSCCKTPTEHYASVFRKTTDEFDDYRSVVKHWESINWLLENGALVVGMREEDVVKLLGKPELYDTCEGNPVVGLVYTVCQAHYLYVDCENHKVISIEGSSEGQGAPRPPGENARWWPRQPNQDGGSKAEEQGRKGAGGRENRVGFQEARKQ